MNAGNNESSGLNAPHSEILNPAQSEALAELLNCVAAGGYDFVTPTPLTHQTVLENRSHASAESLRDIFGWNLPFSTTVVDPALLALMQNAGVLVASGDLFKSAIRIASMEGALFLHSGFPTVQENTVFFGPDTYRFVRFVRQSLQQTRPNFPIKRILDLGCGSGVGGIISAQLAKTNGLARSDDLEVVLNDINPVALSFAAINAVSAQVPIDTALGDAFTVVTEKFDLIVCNPPYLDDGQERLYRHGGAGLGRALGLRLAQEALSHLAPGGRLLFYTGVAIVEGRDEFVAALSPMLKAGNYNWCYEEIDPDIFGEELHRSQYQGAERIAAVGLTAIAPSAGH